MKFSLLNATVNKHTIAGILDVTNFLAILFSNYNLHTDQIGIQLKSPKLELIPNIKWRGITSCLLHIFKVKIGEILLTLFFRWLNLFLILNELLTNISKVAKIAKNFNQHFCLSVVVMFAFNKVSDKINSF